MQLSNQTLVRLPEKEFRYLSFKHAMDKGNTPIDADLNSRLLDKGDERRMKTNGVENVDYLLIRNTEHLLYTELLVHLGKEEEKEEEGRGTDESLT